MLKQSIASILIMAFLNLLGCASTQSFTVSEYIESEGKIDQPDKIQVITKDGQEYHFKEPKMIFESDTLHITGTVKSSSRRGRYLNEQIVDNCFALSDIESIQSETIFFSGSAFLLTLVICGVIYIVLTIDPNPYSQ